MARLLALTMAMFCSALFAENPTPQLITFKQFQYLNPVKKALYLQLAADAIADFERETTGPVEMQARTAFAEVGELFALNFSPLPEASADSAECGRTEFVNSGRSVCVKVSNPGRGFSQDCREAEVQARAQECIPQATKYLVANPNSKQKNVQALQQGHEAGKAAARDAQNKLNDAKYEYRMAKIKDEMEKDKRASQQERADIVAKATNNPEYGDRMKGTADGGPNCPTLGIKEARKALKSYRKKGNACLVGGVVSGYSKPGQPCDMVAAVDEDGGAAPRRPGGGGANGACKDENTFSASREVSKIKAERRTVCQPLLYCKKDKSPFCVEGSADTLGNCDQAPKTHPDKFAFGIDCMPGDTEKARNAWNKLSGSLAEVCNPKSGDTAKQNSILCKDCKKLADALHLAESKAGPPPAETAPVLHGSGTTSY